MAGITPPKCRTCGVAEWRHTCRGPVDIKLIEERAKSAGTKKARKPMKRDKALRS